MVEKNTNLKKIDNVKTILSEQAKGEQEFNAKLEIEISGGEPSTNSDNNQNDIGEISYQGLLEKIGKYKYKSFNNFEYIETKPVFYNENVIFFDNKGTIIFYDKNEKIIWKKNFYNKSEKKKPNLD